MRAPVALLAIWLCSIASLICADEPLAVELGQQEAWTGQPVDLYLTISAPGPFSGQAQFDLPEMPGLYFLATGSPVVGSETVDGSEYFTQRHKWLLFSQREGVIPIPAIRARFEARRSYTGDPEPFTAVSEPVSVVIKRPPGFAADTIVVTTSSLSGEQSWSPDGKTRFETGEAVVRTVTRQVEGSSAMMLAPIDAEGLAPTVRVTAADPDVRDTIERGVVNGTRVDRITYQFLQPGRVEIPPIENDWWNAENDQREMLSLQGLAFDIVAAPPPPPPPRPWWQMLFLIAVGIGVVVSLFFVGQWGWRRWKRWWSAPERVFARRFLVACRQENASAALSSMLAWERLAGFPAGMTPDYEDERERLLKMEYANEETGHWDGRRHANAFRQGLRRRPKRTTHAEKKLPPLNPHLS